MSKPLVIDLCCGLGGWSRAFLDEGWDAVGFDIERHQYGEKCYPGELILADVLTLNGYDLRAANPSLVVASPPCTEYSYMAMPFSRGKRIAAALRGQGAFPEGYTGSRTLDELTAIWRACFRIARELDVPIVLENVKGAQPWMGRAKANYSSYYLWGDIANVGGRIVRPDVVRFGMPAVKAAGCVQKREGRNFHGPERGESSPSFNGAAHETRSVNGVKVSGDYFSGLLMLTHPRRHASRSDSRKAASALIAEIPYDLAAHIARVFKP